MLNNCLHPRADRWGDAEEGYSEDEDAPQHAVPDRAIRREVASEEAGMQLNYKHRKLEGARARTPRGSTCMACTAWLRGGMHCACMHACGCQLCTH